MKVDNPFTFATRRTEKELLLIEFSRTKTKSMSLENILRKGYILMKAFDLIPENLNDLSIQLVKNWLKKKCWYCETKQFRRKIVIPLLLFIKFFDAANFLKHRRVLRNVSVLLDKKFSTRNRDTPSLPLPPLIHKLFCYRKLSETQHRRIPLQNVSVL